MLKSAGGQGKPTLFLLTDSQIKEESFLEDVDSLLNTGEVPNLFAVDEKAELIEVSLRRKMIVQSKLPCVKITLNRESFF